MNHCTAQNTIHALILILNLHHDEEIFSADVEELLIKYSINKLKKKMIKSVKTQDKQNHNYIYVKFFFISSRNLEIHFIHQHNQHLVRNFKLI
jgi:hypothetical protein